MIATARAFEQCVLRGSPRNVKLVGCNFNRLLDITIVSHEFHIKLLWERLRIFVKTCEQQTTQSCMAIKHSRNRRYLFGSNRKYT